LGIFLTIDNIYTLAIELVVSGFLRIEIYMDDRIILYLAALLRAIALGMVGILLAIYLAKIEFLPSVIGIIVSLGLLGGAIAALLVTFLGDYLGRKHSLV